MPIAQNHARKNAEKTKQNPQGQNQNPLHKQQNLLKNKTKQNNNSLERKGGKKTAKQIQACYRCSRSGY
jgi:hypothetical protein